MAGAEGETDTTDVDFFVPDEKSTNAYPTAWSGFGEECWDDLTRASWCTKDGVRDPYYCIG